MTCYKHFISWIFFLLVIPAYAVNVQQFSRSHSLTYEMLQGLRLENSLVHSKFPWIITVGGSWVKDPFTVKDSSASNVRRVLVDSIYSGHLGVAYHWKDSMMFGVLGNYSAYSTPEGDKGQGIEDLKFEAVFNLVQKSKWGIGFNPYVYVPMGGAEQEFASLGAPNVNNVLSDETVGYGASLIFEYVFPWFQMVANLGYREAPDAVFKTLDVQKRMFTGVGAYIPVFSNLGLNIEWARQWLFPEDTAVKKVNPNELYVGLSGGILPNRLAFFGGVSVGNVEQTDDQNYRVSAGIKFTPFLTKEAAAQSSAPAEGYQDLEIEEDEQDVALEEAPVQENEIEEATTFIAEETEEEAPYVVKETTIDCSKRFIFGGRVNAARFYFYEGVGVVTKRDARRLDSQIVAIKSRLNDIRKVVIRGHASKIGSQRLNQKLSRERANNVARYFVSRGIPASMIQKSFHSFNERRAKGRRQSDHALNQRVEIFVVMKNEWNPCFRRN